MKKRAEIFQRAHLKLFFIANDPARDTSRAGRDTNNLSPKPHVKMADKSNGLRPKPMFHSNPIRRRSKRKRGLVRQQLFLPAVVVAAIEQPLSAVAQRPRNLPC
jgi:hypothetical protein